GIIYTAHKQGKKVEVYVDETRPLLQGARLTAWELHKAKIPVTLICDNMAGSLMAQGKIDVVVVGADRITQSGDFANKVGTYALAVLAHYHKIKFYVAAPLSSFDLQIKTGKDIPIEFRSETEVTHIGGKRIAIKGVQVYNPAFDITPARFVTAFITETGIIKPPFSKEIKKQWDEIIV
ncbi:MAG: S-methyl-5-thioribose-1-phosphate isomerase, partial [Candidatus Sumerlaeia bacterium]|nr:S-methyl-5-thioribose-1-phosphate isomerase [Candidatus Sumerlaeia bacterium]